MRTLHVTALLFLSLFAAPFNRQILVADDPMMPAYQQVSQVIPVFEPIGQVVPAFEQVSQVMRAHEQASQLIPVHEQVGQLMPVHEQVSQLMPANPPVGQVMPAFEQVAQAMPIYQRVGHAQATMAYAGNTCSCGASCSHGCSGCRSASLFWNGPYSCGCGSWRNGFFCDSAEVFTGPSPTIYGSAQLLALYRDVRHPTPDPVPAPHFKGDYEAGVLLMLGAQLTDDYRLEASYTGPYSWGNSALINGNLATFNSTLNGGEFLVRRRLYTPPDRYEVSMLVGLRLMEIDDHLTYLGQATQTSNELLGLEGGLLNQFLVNDLCWIDWEIKGAINKNRVSRNGVPATDATAFSGETSLSVNYQFLPSTVLSMGYRGTWLTGLALAEENVNNLQVIDDSGEIVYHGLNFGLTWLR